MLFIVDKDVEDKELRKIYKYLRKVGKANWKHQNHFHFPKASRRLKQHVEFITRRIGQCCCRHTGYESLTWTSHHFGDYRWFFEVRETKD